MLAREEEIPTDWKLASRWDVGKYEKQARKSINQKYAICMLKDGAITGLGYNFLVLEGSFDCLVHKLSTNISFGKYQFINE